MDPVQKQRTIDELHEIFVRSDVVVVAHYAGLTVAEMQDLRKKLRNAGGGIRVAKNKLLRTALMGTQAEGMNDYMSGLTVLAYSEDVVSAVKLIEAYAKQNEKFVILGGAIEGSVFEGASIGEIASLPSRDELISTIVGMIGQPALGVLGILSARDGSQQWTKGRSKKLTQRGSGEPED